jgi:hypothetical protein
MTCFASKRWSYTLLFLLGCALASSALAQSAWKPTEPFELWWHPPTTPRSVFDARQPYAIQWPERQRPGEIQLRSHEREMLSYLDRQANPYHGYLSDQLKQDAVLLGLKVKDVALTLAAPTLLKIPGLVLSTISSFTPRGSTAEQRLTAGASMAEVMQLSIEENLARGPLLFAVADRVLSSFVSDWGSKFVQPEYISENSLSSRWFQDDLMTRSIGKTTVTNWESFQPDKQPGRMGPTSFFDGSYERRTTTSSTYRTATEGGLLFSISELDALERRANIGPLSDFRIEPEALPPKNLGGVSIKIELKEREAQDTGLYESVLEARPGSNTPAWDFPLSTPKENKEKGKENEENMS